MEEVHLAIYDLSGGMARNLSAQFLGPNHAIDMIPHTALLVFGKEYFFGGGIQAVDPYVFRSMRGIKPVQIQSLGTTRISQSEFENWCNTTASTKFNAYSYDLLHNNCNNFTHYAAAEGLKLTRRIPEWILRVPQQFLSSPMGQMIRPMLEQMQITQTAPVQAFAPPSTTPTVSSPETNVNPWANLGSSKSTTAETKPSPPMPSVLEKFTKPMVSNDTQSIPLCVKKLSSKLDDDGKNALQNVADALQGKNGLSNPSLVPKTVSNLLQIAMGDTASTSFVLLFLRLVALKYPKDIQECIQWIEANLKNTKDEPWKNPTTRSLAYCVVSNVCSDNDVATGGLVDPALGDFYHYSVQVRQAASTYLYNYALSKSKQSTSNDDTMVSILCSSLENMVTEKDPTTQFRQLLVCGRLIFPINQGVNEIAKELVQDLGFVDVLQEIAQQHLSLSASDIHKQCHDLATELSNKLV